MSVYLHRFTLPSENTEYNWLFGDDPIRSDPAKKAKLQKVYTSFYPFKVFTKYAEPPTFDFEPITIICGGNGSARIQSERHRLRTPLRRRDDRRL